MNGEYRAKLWLNKSQYLAVLANALVIVTINEKGTPVRASVFLGGETAGDLPEIKNLFSKEAKK